MKFLKKNDVLSINFNSDFNFYYDWVPLTAPVISNENNVKQKWLCHNFMSYYLWSLPTNEHDYLSTENFFDITVYFLQEWIKFLLSWEKSIYQKDLFDNYYSARIKQKKRLTCHKFYILKALTCSIIIYFNNNSVRVGKKERQWNV